MSLLFLFTFHLEVFSIPAAAFMLCTVVLTIHILKQLNRKDDALKQRDSIGACVWRYIRTASPRLSGAGAGGGDGKTRAVGEGCADAVTLPISQSPLFLATEGLHERAHTHTRAQRVCHQPYRGGPD